MYPCSWVRSGLYSSRLAGIWTCRPSSRRVPRSSADAGRLHITPLSACTTRISRSSEGIPTKPAPNRRAFPSPGHRPGGALRRRLPLDPRRPPPVARVALPSDSLGLHKEPLRPSKARTTLARPQGDGCGPSPCDPLGRRLRRCGHCRGGRVHRRRPARGAAARQGGHPIAHAPSPRGPSPVKGPHGTPHKPPRGARGLVEVAVQTPDGPRPPAAAFAREKRRAAGS